MSENAYELLPKKHIVMNAQTPMTVLRRRENSIILRGAALAASLILALPVSLGADDTIIAQDNIELYYNLASNMYALDNGLSYANSGNVSFGTTSSGHNLAVGLSNTGNYLTISSGTVTDYQGYLGFNAGSGGTATVAGVGSTWSNYGSLNVGYYGTGTLNIENNGSVTNTYGYIGYRADSHGTATVTGAGSSWTNSGGLTVGNLGTGTLNIENGGVVTNTNGFLGYESNSHGTATVTGADSTWTNSGYLIVGYHGTGTLNIGNGGSVTNTDGYIGNIADLSGAVTVTGAGSSWTNSGNLYVGSTGTGTLTIENDALVTASSVSVGSGSAIYLNGGYLALAGENEFTDFDTLSALLTDGTKVYAWDALAGGYVLVTSGNSDRLVTLAYYPDITTYDALDAYNLSGAYTVLYGVPESATYALFGGLGALGLALQRKRAKGKSITA
jgi:T5SS/PEP-CTERM-associated repeat protein